MASAHGSKRSKRAAARVGEEAPVYSPRRILLDTHTWLWWYTDDRRLGRASRALIKRADDVRFSAASAWEIAIKAAAGKLIFHGETDIRREIERDGFLSLAITIAHADEVRRLPALHRDPFDRLLVAQARIEGLTIVTADDAIRRYDVSAIDARD